jgi:hypothetical protein
MLEAFLYLVAAFSLFIIVGIIWRLLAKEWRRRG